MVQVDAILEKNRRRMVELLTDLAPREGLNPSLLDVVKFGRSDHSIRRTPVLYEPSVYVVASGRKKGFVGEQRVVYDRNNYLVLGIPLPFECETVVENGEPMLGVSVRMDTSILSELAIQMDARNHPPSGTPNSIRATPLDVHLSGAVVRLLECLQSPTDAAVLGPGVVREITYRVLCGPQGDVLFTMLARNGYLAQVHGVLQRMHTRYAEPLDIATVAKETGMSVSAFHHIFKAVTATSPLQYLKAIRLHKARLLMTHDGIGAATAADRVGYESASQFSREFKRFFAHTPVEEAARFRRTLGLSVDENTLLA